MTLTYSLDNNDYLQHQLYLASKSKRIKNKRFKSWIATTMFFLSLVLLFYVSNNEVLTSYFIVIAFINLILYPFYSRYHYKKHYQTYIDDVYKNRLGETLTVIFNDTTIDMYDKAGEAKINLSEIGEIAEIKDYIYVRIKAGVSLIIPKVKLNDADSVIIYLKSFANDSGISYNTELNWRWK